MRVHDDGALAPAAREEQSSFLPEPRRLEGFSDAAFSIIITLLVLEIHRPHAAEGHLAEELLKAWSSYVAYAVAFIYVGVIWLNHHYLFDRLSKVDFTTNLINLGIIGTAALIPFPTGVLADAFRDGNIADQRAAVMLYAAIASLMSVAWLPALWHLFRHTELAKPQIPGAALAVEVTRPIVGIILYAIAAIVGWLFSPTIAVYILVRVVAFYAGSSRGIVSLGRRKPPRRRPTTFSHRAGFGWALFRSESKDRSVTSADRRHDRARTIREDDHDDPHTASTGPSHLNPVGSG